MNPPRKQLLRNLAKNFLTVTLPIFSVLFVVGATAIIIAIINGYSIDISKRTVIKTGVLNVETNPTDADITVNGTYYGKSNKAIPNLQIGEYVVKISKDGYYPYTHKIAVQHGLASPITAPLLKVNGEKSIMQLPQGAMFDNNLTGYYILSTNTLTTDTSTPTPTPTPTKIKVDGNLTYTLTHIYVTKSLFDSPHPVLDDKMTITSLAASPITSISVSPTGKLVLAILTDKAGKKSISVFPFKKGTTINASLTDSKVLTSYNALKNTHIQWSKDGDYLIVETSSQLISYNVKTGTRVILFEKSEVSAANGQPIWSLTDTGVVLIKKVQGTLTNTYEINDISSNGNPLATQLPLVTFDSKPTRIWSFSETDTPRYIVATATGTYAVGKLYDAKSTDYDITIANTTVGTVPLDHFGNDYTKLKISTDEITQEPLHWQNTHQLIFTESKNQNVTVFTYNKRSADTLTALGKLTAYQNDTALSAPTTLVDGTYVTVKKGTTLEAVDTTGENKIELQTNVQSFSLGQNELTLLFTDPNGVLYFRVLR